MSERVLDHPAHDIDHVGRVSIATDLLATDRAGCGDDAVDVGYFKKSKGGWGGHEETPIFRAVTHPS
jgi:hypothetical protein